MAIGLAAGLVSAVVATLLSTLLYLPALAVVESLSPRRAQLRGGVWLAALFIPLLLGIAGSVLGLTWAVTDPYGSPHLTALRPHLCARWLPAVPDGRTGLTLISGCCLAAYGAAVLRLILGGWRTCSIARRLRPAAQGGNLVVAPDRGVFLATVGFRNPVTVLTTGTQELLDEDELASALEHERAHALRSDNLVDALAAAAMACQIMSPAAHLFLRYWREEAERACDDRAASAVSAEAVSGALRKLADAVRRMPPGLSPRPEWTRAADVEQRAQRLTSLGALPEEPLGRDTMLIGAGLVTAAVVAVGLGIVATAGQARDSIYCLGESVLRVLR